MLRLADYLTGVLTFFAMWLMAFSVLAAEESRLSSICGSALESSDEGDLLSNTHDIINGTVTGQMAEAADQLIAQYAKVEAEREFEVNFFGGSFKPIGIMPSDLPLPIQTLVLDHLEKLKDQLVRKYPKKVIEFISGVVRITEHGQFDIGFLHQDLGGLDNERYTSATTLNTNGETTLFVESKYIHALKGREWNEQLEVPLSYRHHLDLSILALPGYYVKKEDIRRVSPGSTLVIRRSHLGSSDMSRIVRKGTKEQVENLVYNRGLWHASPSLLPIKNKKRFFVGVVFYMEDR